MSMPGVKQRMEDALALGCSMLSVECVQLLLLHREEYHPAKSALTSLLSHIRLIGSSCYLTDEPQEDAAYEDVYVVSYSEEPLLDVPRLCPLKRSMFSLSSMCLSKCS